MKYLKKFENYEEMPTVTATEEDMIYFEDLAKEVEEEIESGTKMDAETALYNFRNSIQYKFNGLYGNEFTERYEELSAKLRDGFKRPEPEVEEMEEPKRSRSRSRLRKFFSKN